MAKKEETYPEGYPRQQENFSDEQKFKFDVFEAIKEIALETTEKAFEDKGYEKKEGVAGEYGDGDTYGAGTSLNHFNIRLSSRPQTDTYFEKIIYFGGKKAITDVNIGWDAKNKTIELAYKNSEFGAFRGYGTKAGASLINDRQNFVIKSLPAFKKELKALFKSFAEKEISYVTSTKIGIEDKTEKSINSMVETSMKKFSLKNLMTSSDEDLSNAVDKYISESKEDKTRMNSPEVIAANSPSTLLFDDIEDIKDEGIKTAAKNKLKKFGVVAINELKPSEKKTYFEELEKELEIKEVTASGGNAAGGAYLTPMAFKKGGDLNLEEKEKFEKTSYAQGQKQKPSVTKSMKEGDSFWTTVELTPGSGYVPKGMEHNFVMGQHDKKLNESMEPKKEDKSLIKESLIKRKFTTLNENEEKGINKRYIVTEQRNESEQNDRWKKLAMFETYETINRDENIIEECGCDVASHQDVSMAQGEAENEREFMQRNSDAEAGGEVDGREVVMVAKPNSLSNAMFKVFRDDYMNESKAYILDLNSGNLVSNPNFRVIK
jgi:hypothetical protein